MVSSTGSQVESAIFQRVIGSLGGEIEFGADVYVVGIEEDGVSTGEGRVGYVENISSGREPTEEGAAEAVADD